LQIAAHVLQTSKQTGFLLAVNQMPKLYGSPKKFAVREKSMPAGMTAACASSCRALLHGTGPARALSALALAALLGAVASAVAQTTAEAPAAPAQAVQAAPVPLPDLVSESETVAARQREIVGDLSADRSAATAAVQLPAITREIDLRLRETRKIVAQNPSIETLRGLQGEWSRLRREIAASNAELTARAHELERHVAQLDGFKKRWEETLQAATDAKVPAEVLDLVKGVLNDIREGRAAVEKQRASVLTLQSRLGVQDSRIADALTALTQARERALNRLFISDSPPIWRSSPGGAERDLQQQSLNSVTRQLATLGTYVERQATRVVATFAIFALALAGVLWLRGRKRARQKDGTQEQDWQVASPVSGLPFATALLLALLAVRWIFPQAPRLFWAVIGALALIPAALILRRVLRPQFYGALYAVIACFLIDQLRSVLAAVDLVPRLLFLGEMLGVAIFSAWVIRGVARMPAPDARARRFPHAAAVAALAISCGALVANGFGYVTLGNLLGNALLRSFYLGLLLYALVEVLDWLFACALDIGPLAALTITRRHRPLVRRRLRRLLQWAAILLWSAALLQQLMLRDPLIAAIGRFLAAELRIGSIQTSPGDIVAFVTTIWAAFLVSRFVRFLLEEDVYPRVRLKRGLSYAISNTLHYLILLIGFFLAVAALGFDMTQVTILVGAFSVGVGFGLQNIFNNFISGLILLFERPINIGDIIQIDDGSGVVEHIGVRASIIRMSNGSEVIMPNGKLISERLVNWTLSGRRYGVELPVTVGRGPDPQKVIGLLERTAATHPLVSNDDPPQALVVKLGPDALGFELRAWTEHAEQWMQIRSELAIAINAALAAENIAIR
jgi:small-conductance mechanosensitive channel